MPLLEIPVGSKEFESCAKFNPMKDISLGIGMGNMPKMKLPTLSVLLVITALGFCQTTWAQTNSGQSSTSQVSSGQVNSGPPKEANTSGCGRELVYLVPKAGFTDGNRQADSRCVEAEICGG